MDQSSLKEYIKKNNLDKKDTLIQIYTSNSNKEQISNVLDTLNNTINNPKIIGTSTAGVIESGKIVDNEIVLSFLVFESSSVCSVGYSGMSSTDIVKELSNYISDNTKLLFIYADTFGFDATSLLNQLTTKYPNIYIAGGNSGDDYNFKECTLFTQDGFCDVSIAIIDSSTLSVDTKYLFNWQTIGKKMRVTKSDGIELLQIDNKPALDIYRHYLGDDIADNILEYGIEFPIVYQEGGVDVARAAVSVDIDKGSISFAGDVPEGKEIRFGYANIEHIDNHNKEILKKEFEYKQEAIFVFSCGSRRMMLGNFLNNELSMIDTIAPNSGFITYGEFFHSGDGCKNNLLNITTTYVVLNESKPTQKIEICTAKRDRDRKDITLKALSTLLDKTSGELDFVIKNLEDEIEKKVDEIREKDSLINQQSKMSEVGNMIGTIAHQWQQPLNILVLQNGILEFKMMQLYPQNGSIDEYIKQRDQYIADFVEKNKQQIEFMSQTIKDFTSFLKPIKEKIGFSITNQIEQIIRILKPILDSEKVVINIENSSSEDTIIGFPSEFSQVVLNIINNAKDAMIDNNIEDNNRLIDINIKNIDKKIVVSIQDYAGGIPKDSIGHIFENYYTTKDSYGTGIGLFISKKIIEKMGGTISVTNQNGGACFSIEFVK
jgi:signal transduction histidine kinase